MYDYKNKNKKNSLFKLSRYAHIYNKKGKFAIYHSLKMDIVYCDKKTINLLEKFKHPSKLNDDEFRKPSLKQIKRNFLIPHNYTEENLIDKINQNFLTFQFIPTVLVLFVTTKCNFYCKYCLIRNNILKEEIKDMDWQTAKKAIDIFLALSKKRIKKTIFIYGGEPLLNWELVKMVTKYCRKKENDLEICINTNGSLLNEEIINFLKEFNVQIIISIDGPKKFHDKMRVFIDRSGTYDIVYKGYKLAKDVVPLVGVSCTLNEHNVFYVEKLINFFYEKIKPVSLGLDLPHKVPNWREFNYSYKDLGNAWIKAYLIASNKGLYIEHIMRKVRPLVEKKIKYKECSACGNRMVVLSNGEVLPCEGLIGKKKYYQKLDISLRESLLFKEWNNRTPFHISKCYDCPAIGICGGNCPYNALIDTGSIWEVDHQACVATKMLLEFLIWRLEELIKYNELPYIVKNSDRKLLYGNIIAQTSRPLRNLSFYHEMNNNKHEAF